MGYMYVISRQTSLTLSSTSPPLSRSLEPKKDERLSDGDFVCCTRMNISHTSARSARAVAYSTYNRIPSYCFLNRFLRQFGTTSRILSREVDNIAPIVFFGSTLVASSAHLTRKTILYSLAFSLFLSLHFYKYKHTFIRVLFRFSFGLVSFTINVMPLYAIRNLSRHTRPTVLICCPIQFKFSHNGKVNRSSEHSAPPAIL